MSQCPGYLTAVVGVAFAVLARALLQQVARPLPPYLTFYPVVFATAVIGGTGPGVFATILSALASDYYFTEPARTLALPSSGELASMIFFIAVNFGVSVFGGRFRAKSEALRKNANRTRMALQVTRVGSFEWNVETGKNAWSPELETMHGLKVGQFGGKKSDWEALVHPEDLPRVLASVERALNTFAPEEDEWRVVWPDGSVHWLLGRFQAFPNRVGRPLRVVGVNIDITDRKKGEEAMRQREELLHKRAAARETEERFRTMVDAIPHQSWIARADGHVFWFNRRFFEYTGLTQQQLEGWGWEQLPEPQILPEVLRRWRHSIKTGEPFEMEVPLRGADGRFRTFLARAVPLREEHGRVSLWFGTLTDVTEQEEAREVLRLSEERFRTMVDDIPNQAWIARPDGYLFWFNRRCFEYTGLTQEELEGWGWRRLFDAQTLPVAVKRWRHSLETGEPFEMEMPVRGVDGGFRTFLTRAVPVRDEQGSISLWFGTLTDVTEQKEAREVLRRGEERFHTMVDSISQLAWICRADGYFMWFNSRVYEYTGATLEQLEGSGWGSVLDPQALPKVQEIWNHSVATGTPFVEMELLIRGADGQFRPFLAHTIPVKDEAGRVKLWFGTGTEISQLREREKALARQARLIDLSPTATLALKPDHTITFWSDGAERLYGWSRNEALGRRSHELLRTTFPEPLESMIAKVQDRGVWTGELRQLTRDNREIVVQSYWQAERNAKGELEELLESNNDITERRRLQEHLEEEVQARTAKLREAVADLEHMSYSMVHDMRAPLRAMHGFAVLLEEECADYRNSPASDYLHYIRESSNRLDRLITDALNYKRVVSKKLTLAPVEIGRLLSGMIQTYPHLHPRLANITIDFENLSVLGNESFLTQCLGNLLENAVKFVAPGVRPCIHIWAEEINQKTGPAMERIWIADNGIGIPKTDQEKIFQMFQRMHTEAEYPGTGVGLAIVKKAVERMNGRVGLESEPGNGSKFWIELPTAAGAESQAYIHEAG